MGLGSLQVSGSQNGGHPGPEWRTGELDSGPAPCVTGAMGPSHLTVMGHIGLPTGAMVLNLSGKVSWGLPSGGLHPWELAIKVISEKSFEGSKPKQNMMDHERVMGVGIRG